MMLLHERMMAKYSTGSKLALQNIVLIIVLIVAAPVILLTALNA